MKPIDKWRDKFTDLLKEAEDELGDFITIKVSSKPKLIRDGNCTSIYGAYTRTEGREYDFELHTNSFVY